MKIEPGYYAAYRTSGKGAGVRLLSRRFPAVQEGLDPAWLRQTAEDWMRWERQEHPLKNVVLIQVLEDTTLR